MTIDNRADYNQAMGAVKIKMTVIGGSNALWQTADNCAAAQPERRAFRITGRDVFAEQPWADSIDTRTVAFVVSSTGTLARQLTDADVANHSTIGLTVEEAYASGYGV